MTSLTLRSNFYKNSSQLLGSRVVLTTLSDKRCSVCNEELGIAFFEAEVLTQTDYYPFGAVMPDRQWSAGAEGYRYGFNGMERDDETYGKGNALDFGARIYDSRLGRWFKLDTYFRLYPSQSVNNFGLNSPVNVLDVDCNTIVPYNEYTRSQLNQHFQRVFNSKAAALLTENLSMDGTQRSISRKEFRRAIKGMSSEQKALARGYYKMINAEKKALIDFQKQDELIPDGALITKHAVKMYSNLTMGELMKATGGGAAMHANKSVNTEYSTSIFINPEADFTAFEIDGLDDQGNSGEWKDGKYSTPKGFDVTTDEVIAHEIIGHGFFGGFLDQTSKENVTAIQVSNLLRKGQYPLRSGESDHKVDSRESPPFSQKHKPRVDVNAVPDELKKD